MNIAGLESPPTREQLNDLIDNPLFRPNTVMEYGRWRVYLNSDQRYLGRAYAWYTGAHRDLQDIGDLSAADTFDLLHRVVPAYRDAVKKLWGASHLNYFWGGNETHLHRGHGHLHLIPRYFAAPPNFGGTEFPDQRIGKNYAPYEPNPVTPPMLIRIRDILRAELEPKD